MIDYFNLKMISKNLNQIHNKTTDSQSTHRDSNSPFIKYIL